MSMTHDEMIAVIAHHRDGGKIEFQSGEQWVECGCPSFDFYRIIYRIKLEPRSLWVVRYQSGNAARYHENKDSATYSASSISRATIHEYKEVLP